MKHRAQYILGTIVESAVINGETIERKDGEKLTISDLWKTEGVESVKMLEADYDLDFSLDSLESAIELFKEDGKKTANAERLLKSVKEISEKVELV